MKSEMELNTTILFKSGSFYIRIPPAFVEYFQLKEKAIKEAKIKDVSDKEIVIYL